RHRRFRELPEELTRDELVVVNDSRVIAARLRLRRPGGGAAEVLLLEPVEEGLWEALARPSARLRAGTRLGPIEFVEPLAGGCSPPARRPFACSSRWRARRRLPVGPASSSPRASSSAASTRCSPTSTCRRRRCSHS